MDDENSMLSLRTALSTSNLSAICNFTEALTDQQDETESDLGDNILTWAVWNDVRVVSKRAINGGANLHHQLSSATCPLHEAARQTDTRYIDLLLDAGASAMATNQYNETAIHAVVHQMGLAAAPAVIASLATNIAHLASRGTNVDHVADDYRTALMIAASNGTESAARALITAGCDLNVVTRCGTALMCALASQQTAMADLLLEHGADPEIHAPLSDPPLIQVCAAGNVVGVAYLLHRGADPNVVSDLYVLLCTDETVCVHALWLYQLRTLESSMLLHFRRLIRLIDYEQDRTHAPGSGKRAAQLRDHGAAAQARCRNGS